MRRPKIGSTAGGAVGSCAPYQYNAKVVHSRHHAEPGDRGDDDGDAAADQPQDRFDRQAKRLAVDQNRARQLGEPRRLEQQERSIQAAANVAAKKTAKIGAWMLRVFQKT